MVKVEQLINDNDRPAANQFVIYIKNRVYFQSYKSVVAEYDKSLDRLILGSSWDYSKTTIKHLLIFIRNFTSHSSWNTAELREAIKRGDVRTVPYNFNNAE